MKHLSSLLRGGLSTALLILLWLAGPAARAQAPAWQSAMVLSQTSVFGVTATATDASGNIYLTGSFGGTVSFGNTSLTSVGGNDIFLVKWDPATSSFTWAQRAGGTNNDLPIAIAVSGTAVYISGYFGAYSGTTGGGSASFGSATITSAGDQDAFVAKLTDSGATSTFLWAQRAGSPDGDVAGAVAVSGTSVYMAGSFDGSSASFGNTTLSRTNGSMFISKLTDLGSTSTYSWTQQGGRAGQADARTLAVNGTSVYVGGSFSGITAGFGTIVLTNTDNTGSPYGVRDAYIAKLTDAGTTGSFVWVQQAGGRNDDGIKCLAVRGTSVYAAGYLHSLTATLGPFILTNSGTTGIADIFIAKLTDAGSTGSFTWVQRAGGSTSEIVNAMAINGTSIYIVGAFNSPTVSFGTNVLTNASNGFEDDVFVAKMIDAGTTGNFVWAQRAGGVADDRASAISLSGTSVYVAGSAVPPASFGNFVLANPINTYPGFLAALTDPTLTATTAPQSPLSFTLSPNPARAAATLTLPAQPGAATATLTLRDALGRALRTETLSLPAAGLRHVLDLRGLAPGIYAVQVLAGAATATRRLVVE